MSAKIFSNLGTNDMDSKKCSVCKRSLPRTSEFFTHDKKSKDSFCSFCKDCKHKKYQERMNKLKDQGKYLEYREKEKERVDKWNKENAKHLSDYWKKYHLEHKEQNKERCRKNYSENHAKYLSRQKEYYQNHSKEISEYYRIKRSTDPVFRMKSRVRCTIKDSFKRRNCKKNKLASEITGLNSQDLHEYLLKTFEENYGYKWDGVEPVDIDHIVPLSTASTEEDVIKLCHYSNLQLLKASDNRSKQNKINYSIGGTTKHGNCI